MLYVSALEEGHLHAARMSNKSPDMRLQAGLDAAPGPHIVHTILANVIHEGLNKLPEFFS